MKLDAVKKISLVLLFFTLCAATAFPYEVVDVTKERPTYNPSNWKKEPAYVDRAFGKLTYAAWNFMFGWMELGTKPYEAAAVGNSVVIGLVKGVFNAVFDELAGFANMLTFPITAVQVPYPDGGIERREF